MSLLGNLTVGILGNASGMSNTFNQAQNQVRNFGRRMESVGKDISTIGTHLTAAVTVPIVGLATAAVRSAIKFESAFAGVKKTVDATDKQLAELRQGILDMSKTIPVAATEIAGIAEAAGQLGIKTENILGFTRVMADLGVATNMTSEQAATDLARLANITQMSQKDFDRLGSSIVALGNNFATTESEIVSMALRLAGQGAQLGMTEAQINALATAMSSVGIEAEAGGTAMSTIMKKLDIAVATGGKHFEGFVEVAGVSAKEFTKQWKDDPVMALDTFIKGLNRTSKEGGNLAETLGFLGIKGIREQDTLLRLAGASDILSDAVKISTDAWKENTALTNEAEQRYATTESQLQILKNRFNDILGTIGDALIPALLNTVNALDPLIKMFEKAAHWFANLSPAAQTVAIAIAAVAAAIGPALVILGTLISSVGTVMTAFAGLSGAITAAGGVMGILTGPIGLTIGAIVALGAALIALWKNSETFRNSVTNIFNKIKEVAIQVFGIVASFIGEKIAQIKKFWDENGAQFLAAVEKCFNGILAVVKFCMPLVLFIVNMVWSAIKQVIDGALNIIMGLMKVFAGIFTGDFSKMWEGIKQIFRGAIDFVLGIMTLTFVGGLRSLLTNLAKTGISLIKNLGSGIVNTFKSFTSLGKNLAQGMVNSVLNFFRNLLDAGVTLFRLFKARGASTFEAFKGVTMSIFNSLKSGLTSIWNGTINFLRNGTTIMKNAVVNGIRALVNGATSIFQSIKGKIQSIWNGALSYLKSINLVSIGKNIIQGLINGIGSMASAVYAKVKSIANNVTNTIKKALQIHSPSRVTTKLGEHTGQGLVNGISKKGKAVAVAAKKVADEAIKNLEVKFDTKKISATKYIEGLKKIQKQYKLTGDQARKVQKELYQANQSIQKQAEANKKTIDKINKGVKDANNSYLSKVKSINDKLKNDIKRVKDDFQKQLADLRESIYNQKGLFDKVESKKVNGTDLLNNLQDQNKQFKQWQKDLASLQKKGVSKDLVEELRQMGVKSADEINAIANMPKAMLDKYVAAWKEKHKLANNEADTQMQGAKADIQKQIDGLNEAAKKELGKARTDWINKIKGFTDQVKKLGDFKDSGKVLGKNTVSGLIIGLGSMKGPLEKEARALAKTIEKTVKDTLKIKSPSRVFRDQIGKMLPAGLIKGMDSMKSKVIESAQNMANAAIPEVPQIDTSIKFGNTSSTSTGTMNSFDDSTIVGLLKVIANKIGNGDIYLGTEKVGAVMDREQAKRTDLYGRRVAY